MGELIILKLGGSLITDKDKTRTARMDTLKRLAEEIKSAKEKDGFDLIICNGSGSFAHQSAKKYETNKGIITEQSYRGISIVASDAIDINRITVKTLIDAGLNAITVQPSAIATTEDGNITEFNTSAIKLMLDNRQIPVLYGDIAMDKKQGVSIISGDRIINQLAKDLKPKRIIFSGNYDGVWDKDKKLIPEITNSNFKSIRSALGASQSTDVTGGMLSKVEEILEYSDLGISTIILNGSVKDRLRDCLKGNPVPCTVIR